LSPSRKSGPKFTPPKEIKKFIAYVDEHSEPADSSTLPVFTSKGIKSPVRRLTKPIDTIINDYDGFAKHIRAKESSKYKRKLRSSTSD